MPVPRLTDSCQICIPSTKLPLRSHMTSSIEEHPTSRSLLRRLNWLCAIVHLTLTVVTLSSGSPDLKVVLFEVEIGLNPAIEAYFNATAQNVTPPTGMGLDVQSFLLPRIVESVSIPITLLCAMFPALSFFFHLGHGLLWRERYEEWVINMKAAPTRWLEYSMSASIMMFALAPLSGLLVLSSMLNMAALVAITQIFGFLTELVARPQGDRWSRPRSLILSTHLFGWIPQLMAWYILVSPLVSVVSADDGGPPAFVFALILAEFLLFTSFGFVQIVLYGWFDPRHYVYGEVAYQLLSLIAKTLLTVVLISQVLIFERFECIYADVDPSVAVVANC